MMMQQAPNQKPIKKQKPLNQKKEKNIVAFDEDDDEDEYFHGESIRLLQERDKNKEIAAVIVSFCKSQTYDELFTTVEQKAMEGTQVLVYACSSHAVKDIYDGMREKECSNTVKEMLANMKEVHPDCVVFNWECCEGYCGQKFPQGRDIVF